MYIIILSLIAILIFSASIYKMVKFLIGFKNRGVLKSIWTYAVGIVIIMACSTGILYALYVLAAKWLGFARVGFANVG